MNKKLWVIILLIAIFSLGHTVKANGDKYDIRELESSGEIKKLGQVMAQVSANVPGRILEVNLERFAGMYVYQIEVLDDNGVLWEVEIDASSGNLLQKQKE